MIVCVCVRVREIFFGKLIKRERNLLVKMYTCDILIHVLFDMSPYQCIIAFWVRESGEKNRRVLEGLYHLIMCLLWDVCYPVYMVDGSSGENSCRSLLVTTEPVQEICWTLKKIIASSV